MCVVRPSPICTVHAGEAAHVSTVLESFIRELPSRISSACTALNRPCFTEECIAAASAAVNGMYADRRQHAAMQLAAADWRLARLAAVSKHRLSTVLPLHQRLHQRLP